MIYGFLASVILNEDFTILILSTLDWDNGNVELYSITFTDENLSKG
jgi:hypothetical protein